MRLVCPNCGAQYEVADDVIPENGRDVQCSNCGNTWFETPGASDAAEAEIEMPAPAEAEIDVAPTADAIDTEMPVTEDRAEPAPRELDPSVAEILREEAAREEAARTAERGDAIESQTEMGLPEVEEAPQTQRQQETENRIARLKGEEANVAAAAAAAAASRKELLPDIEEINSTLRSSEERGETVADTPEVVEEIKRRGFRTGFLTMILIVLVLILIYMFANQISDMIPALAGPLDSYTSLVDSARLWLDSKVEGLRDSMQSAVDANNGDVTDN